MYRSRQLSNVSIKKRIRQVVVLVFTIIIGILISQSTQAQGFRNSIVSRHETGKVKIKNIRNNKVDYRRLNISRSECKILARKRNYVPKAPLFASSRKPKYVPMAEVDSPYGRKATPIPAQGQ